MITAVHPRTSEEVQEEIRAIKRFTARICQSKESARNFLIRAGYMTKSGKLAKKYR